MKNKIGFVGLGFVGASAHNTFKKHCETETYDLDKSKCTVESIKELMERCSVIFVAVPTPIGLDGSCHMANIHSVFSKLNKYGDGHTVILKSSVPPGTTKVLNTEYSNIGIVFNPEFLREKTAKEDFANQDRIILGGEEGPLKFATEAYRKAFPESIPVYHTDSTTAEMVKFFTNIFLACKVSLSNEFFQMCEKLNIQYEDVRKLAVLDERIGSSHTSVPGEGTASSTGGRGFGGACFPINLNIIIHLAEQLGAQPLIMKAMKERNEKIDRPEKDWLEEGRTIVSK